MPAGKMTLYKPKRKYTKRKMAVVEVAKPTQKTPSKLLINTVRKIISKDTETKQAFHTTGPSLVFYNSGIDSSGDMSQILPSISQGLEANNRIGEQIKAKSLNVKGYMKLNVNDVADSTKLTNVIVRMMIVSLKVRSCFPDAQGSTAQLQSLLRKGGTTTGFSGVLSDIYAPINTDLWTVHHDKKFYLSQSFVNVTGASPPTTVLAQDISKTVKFFNFNVKCKNKVLKYDEDTGSDIYPTNFAPMLLLGYSYLDGSSADVLSTNVALSYEAVLNYEDA